MFISFYSKNLFFIPFPQITTRILFLSLIFVLANHLAPLLLLRNIAIFPEYQNFLATLILVALCYVVLYGFYRSTFIYLELLYFFVWLVFLSSIPQFIILKLGYNLYSITQLLFSVLIGLQLLSDHYKKFIAYNIFCFVALLCATLLFNMAILSDLQLLTWIIIYNITILLTVLRVKKFKSQPTHNRNLLQYYTMLLQHSVANLRQICEKQKSIAITPTDNPKFVKLKFSPYKFLYFSSTVSYHITKILNHLKILDEYCQFKKTNQDSNKSKSITNQLLELILQSQEESNDNLNITLVPIDDFIFQGDSYCLLKLLSHLFENCLEYTKSGQIVITLRNNQILLSIESKVSPKQIAKKINKIIKTKFSANLGIYFNSVFSSGYDITIKKKNNDIIIQIG